MTFFCEPTRSNVIPIRRELPPTVKPAPDLDPPYPDEVRAARLYDLGDFTMQAFVRCCGGSQIRAGRALDEWLRRKR